MCPACWIPGITALLSFLGLGSVHLFLDTYPIISLIIVVVSIGMVIWSTWKLWKYFTKTKICHIEKKDE